MTDWEKIQRGEIYNDFAEDLYHRRVRAKKLFREYNRTDDSETEKRSALLAELFESVGTNVWVEPVFLCEYGKNITIGNDVYINFDCIILDCAKVAIGNNVLIGPRVSLYPVNHAIDPTERMTGGCQGEPIVIGDRVWIGGDVQVTAGVTIGDDTIIGAGSVVTKSIPAGVIAAGNPCKVIRKITDRDKTGYRGSDKGYELPEH